jgi:hypothetical protein
MSNFEDWQNNMESQAHNMSALAVEHDFAGEGEFLKPEIWWVSRMATSMPSRR